MALVRFCGCGRALDEQGWCPVGGIELNHFATMDNGAYTWLYNFKIYDPHGYGARLKEMSK